MQKLINSFAVASLKAAADAIASVFWRVLETRPGSDNAGGF